MNKTDISQAVFGSFDGMTSLWGIMIALASKPSKELVVAAVGLSIAATVGMGAGEYLGDTESKGSYKRASIMALATAFGGILPVLPFLFLPHSIAFVIAAIITLVLCAIIGYFRGNNLKAYLQTYLILIVVTVLTALFSLIAGTS